MSRKEKEDKMPTIIFFLILTTLVETGPKRDHAWIGGWGSVVSFSKSMKFRNGLSSLITLATIVFSMNKITSGLKIFEKPAPDVNFQIICRLKPLLPYGQMLRKEKKNSKIETLKCH